MNVTIPDYDPLILPLLRLSSDGETHSFSDTVDLLADEPGLTAEERAELLSGSTQTAFEDRMERVKAHMKEAGLLDFPKTGLFRITQRGRDVLKSEARQVDDSTLGQYAEYEDIKTLRHRSKVKNIGNTFVPAESSRDQLAIAFRRYQSELENDLLAAVKQAEPSQLEHIVVDLLVAMGYGDNKQDPARAIKQTDDGGVAGVIKRDMEVIYVRAKRFDGTIEKLEIHCFADALKDEGANKGVYISTSGFSKEAIAASDTIDCKITLIGGVKLASLMNKFNLGVSTSSQYLIKKINPAYFSR